MSLANVQLFVRSHMLTHHQTESINTYVKLIDLKSSRIKQNNSFCLSSVITGIQLVKKNLCVRPMVCSEIKAIEVCKFHTTCLITYTNV